MSSSSLKVLIVDDSPLVRNLLADLIGTLEGVEVIGEAVDGPGALELVSVYHPDFVTLDLRMPDESGYEVLRKLKALERPPRVAVLTNFPFSDARRRCAELGADYFFDKATEISKLVEVLRNAIVQVP